MPFMHTTCVKHADIDVCWPLCRLTSGLLAMPSSATQQMMMMVMSHVAMIVLVMTMI